MSLFNRFYNRPGGHPDAPRKKGLLRLWEILDRDLWKLLRSSSLAVAGSIPFVVLMWFATASKTLLYALLAGLLGGAVAGPELTALSDTLLRSLRDEPGFWSLAYRKCWRREWKRSLLPGAVFGTIIALQMFLFLMLGEITITPVSAIAYLLGVVLTLGAAGFVFPQIALMDLSFGDMLKNALLLLFGNPKRGFGAALWQTICWGLLAIFLPGSIWAFVLLGFWVPVLPALFVLYTILDQRFGIEESLRASRESGEAHL